MRVTTLMVMFIVILLLLKFLRIVKCTDPMKTVQGAGECLKNILKG